MARRFSRFDLYLTKNKSVSDNAQIPAGSVNADLYRQGATAVGSGSVAPAGSGTITVRNAGLIAVGDTLFIGTAVGVTATVTAGLTETSIPITAGGATFAWGDGARIRPLNSRPSTFVESTGNVATASASRITTDALGHAFCYAEEESVEALWSTDGSTFESLADWQGVGGNVFLSNEFDNATAEGFLFKLKRALTTAGAKAFVLKNSAGTTLFSVDKDGVFLAANSITNAMMTDNAINTAELVDGAVTALKLALGSTLKIHSVLDKPVANFDFTSATFTLVTGVTLTITPVDTNSEFIFLAMCPYRETTANATNDGFRIQNTTDTVTIAEADGRGAATDSGDTVTLVGYRTGAGWTASKTFEVQAARNAGTGTPRVFSARPIKFIVLEFRRVI